MPNFIWMCSLCWLPVAKNHNFGQILTFGGSYTDPLLPMRVVGKCWFYNIRPDWSRGVTWPRPLSDYWSTLAYRPRPLPRRLCESWTLPDKSSSMQMRVLAVPYESFSRNRWEYWPYQMRVLAVPNDSSILGNVSSGRTKRGVMLKTVGLSRWRFSMIFLKVIHPQRRSVMHFLIAFHVERWPFMNVQHALRVAFRVVLPCLRFPSRTWTIFELRFNLRGYHG